MLIEESVVRNDCIAVLRQSNHAERWMFKGRLLVTLITFAASPKLDLSGFNSRTYGGSYPIYRLRDFL